MSEESGKCWAAEKFFAERHFQGIENGIKVFMVLLKTGADLFLV
jgi:hypothetical protein